MKNKRVVVAMSGGVDSSVAAALLKNEGYDVIGMTMKMWPKTTCGYEKKRACCSLEGISDARFVAEKIGIPYYVIDLEAAFRKEVIDYFARQYLDGFTPNPCVICNEKMKFGHLLYSAKKAGAGMIATGHHARLGHDRQKSRFYIRKGRDGAKDQSYALFSLSQNQLAHALLPIGDFTKSKVRSLAKKFGLRNVCGKPDSQEICFIPDGDFQNFLIRETGVKPNEGAVVDTGGRVLGRHKGIQFYTVGQRHGLGIAHKKPLYIVKLEKETNRIVAGEKKDVRSRSFLCHEYNGVLIEKITGPLRCEVKIRHTHRASAAAVKDENGGLRVVFDEPQEAITPGQAAVFYERDKVIGGAWIKEVLA